MENKAIKSFAQYLALWLNRYINKEGLEFAKLMLGMEIFLINASKVIIIYSLALIFGTFPQTAIIHVAFILTKRHSFGLHALNSTVCTIVSCTMFVLTPWILSDAGIGNGIVLAAFALIISCQYLYAPADTKAWPLIGRKLRERMKRNAVACVAILMITALVIPSGNIKLLLTIGAAYQTIAILPLSYKILKRSEKNYEEYEKCA